MSYPRPEIEELAPAPENEEKIHNVLWYITINSNRQLMRDGIQQFQQVIDDLFYNHLYLLFQVMNPEEGLENGLVNLNDIVRMRVSRYYETGTMIGRYHVHILVRLSHKVPTGVKMRIDPLKIALKTRLGYNVYIKPKVHADQIENLEQYIFKTQGKQASLLDKQSVMSVLVNNMR